MPRASQPPVALAAGVVGAAGTVGVTEAVLLSALASASEADKDRLPETKTVESPPPLSPAADVLLVAVVVDAPVDVRVEREKKCVSFMGGCSSEFWA